MFMCGLFLLLFIPSIVGGCTYEGLEVLCQQSAAGVCDHLSVMVVILFLCLRWMAILNISLT